MKKFSFRRRPGLLVTATVLIALIAIPVFIFSAHDPAEAASAPAAPQAMPASVAAVVQSEVAVREA
jgi:membrane fusion protein, multidrug efflux system